MVNRKFTTGLFIITLFAIFSPFVFSQTNTTSRTQKIVWQQDDYASKYKIIIEKINEQDSDNDNTDVENEGVKNAKTTTQVFEQETTSTAVTTSLPAGTYRYRITKYDLLGRQAKVSEWFTLVIQKLAKPEIIKLLPTSPIFVEHESLVFSIEGLNVIEESKITLISEDKKNVFEVKIQNIDNSSNKIQIQIDNFDNALVEGNYVLHIDNPENLSCTSEVFKLKKAIDPDKVPVITKT